MPTPDFWTPAGVARACGGSLLGGGARPLSGVCTDTRSIEPGCLFIALVGERFDAHDFVKDAVANGAAAVVAGRPVGEIGVPVIRVGDTGAALAGLAGAWRRELTGTRLTGVTGSNGKTTTVRMIDAVLGASLRGRASIKSFNNAIGVPLTVLGARPGDAYLVAEAGMNAPGEMEPLSRILRPDIAVITSIGRAHIGAFADGLRGIAREKAALAAHLAPDGCVVATADSPELRGALDGDGRVIWVGEAADAAHRVIDIEPAGGGVSFRLGGSAFRVNAPGRHNAMNAAVAVTVGRRMGLRDEPIRAGLERFVAAPMRLERMEIGGLTVINDAYNANPESMIAALRLLASATGGRRVAVLGQMLEMGERTDELHREVARFLRDELPGAVDRLITVGPGARVMHEVFPGEHFDTLDDGAAERLASMLREGGGGAGGGGGTVLLKGSRGVGLERIVASLRADGCRNMIGA